MTAHHLPVEVQTLAAGLGSAYTQLYQFITLDSWLALC